MNKAEIYTSPLIDELLKGVDSAEASRIEKRMLLAARIDDALKAKGWKQKELAAVLNKKPSEITKWLSGTHNFTCDTLFDIERVLGLDLFKLENKSKEIILTYHFSVESKVDRPLHPNYITSFGEGKLAHIVNKSQSKLISNNIICQA